MIKDALFPVPPLFDLIKKESQTSGREMYQVFNMGHRMEFYVPPSQADEIISISNSFNVDAKIVGSVEASSVKKLNLKTPYGSYEYL